MTTLDRRITLADKKLAALQTIKKGMLQKIFSQELRFKDDDGNEFPVWEQKSLGEVFVQTNETCTPCNEIPLYSLTIEDGLTEKTDRYNREYLTKKDDGYKIVRPGWLVYNPMNMTLGAIGYNSSSMPVAVSGYYITMFTNKMHDNCYFLYWLKSKEALHLYRKYATGTLVEKQRVQFPTFESIKVNIPSLPEQQKIAAYFATLDHSIATAQKKAAALRAIKKGLLQKMFI